MIDTGWFYVIAISSQQIHVSLSDLPLQSRSLTCSTSLALTTCELRTPSVTSSHRRHQSTCKTSSRASGASALRSTLDDLDAPDALLRGHYIYCVALRRKASNRPTDWLSSPVEPRIGRLSRIGYVGGSVKRRPHRVNGV